MNNGAVPRNIPDGKEITRRFLVLLDRYRRGDGEQWRAVEIARATGLEVSPSYLSALKRAELRKPGHDKLGLIADVMGFPRDLWYTAPEDWDDVPGGRPPQPPDEIAELEEKELEVVQVMRRLPDNRKDAVVTIARQIEVL